MGGAVGYFSYDLCHFIENVPGKAIDDLQLPECCLGLYDVVVTFDHRDHRTYIASSGFPEQDEGRRLARARERLAQVKARIADARQSAARAERTDNPHHAAYKIARKKYEAFGRASLAIKKEFDTATGAQRMDLEDELRGRRREEIELKG